MSESCEACGHNLMLHFDPVNGGPGACQEDIAEGDFEKRILTALYPCPCEGAPQDANV